MISLTLHRLAGYNLAILLRETLVRNNAELDLQSLYTYIHQRMSDSLANIDITLVYRCSYRHERNPTV